MSAIPTLTQLINTINSSIQARLEITFAEFGKVYLKAYGGVQGAVVRLLYLELAMVQKNVWVDQADPERTGGSLERWGRLYLRRNPFPAKAGQYRVTLTGSTGGTIPSQTTFVADDDSSCPGKMFITDSKFILAGASGAITIRALEAGVESQLSPADTLSITVPLANVNTSVIVTVELEEPQDAETDEEYRAKAIEAAQLEPQGGAGSDYRIWSFDVQGIERVYPYAKSNAVAEINLYVEATAADSTDGKGTPSQALLDSLEAVVEFDPDTTRDLDERGRRPLGVFVIHYLPVSIKEISVIVSSYAGLNTDIQTAIQNDMAEYVSSFRPFVASVDILSTRNDILDTNKLVASILQAKPGSSFGSVTLKVDGITYPSYQFINGNIPHFNSLSFI